MAGGLRNRLVNAVGVTDIDGEREGIAAGLLDLCGDGVDGSLE
jgi:hypothetical protein